jgi:hypothetical protein
MTHPIPPLPDAHDCREAAAARLEAMLLARDAGLFDAGAVDERDLRDLRLVLAELRHTRHALMCRIQTENDCAATGHDCGSRKGAGPCSCALEAQGDMGIPITERNQGDD